MKWPWRSEEQKTIDLVAEELISDLIAKAEQLSAEAEQAKRGNGVPRDG